MRRDFSLPQKYTAPKRMRIALENAVRRQLMCDVPFGLLISGGVDSSLIAAIAARFAAPPCRRRQRGVVAAPAFVYHRLARCP